MSKPGTRTVEVTLTFDLPPECGTEEFLEEITSFLFDARIDGIKLLGKLVRTADIVLDLSCERCGKVGAHSCHPEYRHKLDD